MAIRFERTTHLERPPDIAFDTSLDVTFHTDSMAESREQIVGGITSGVMGLGDTVTWRARHFGIWWQMTTVISAYERPRYFVDEQVKGPFKRYHHVHYFDDDDTGTCMRDVVEFAAPFGLLGLAAERLMLRRHMTALIDLRNAQLREHLAAARDR